MMSEYDDLSVFNSAAWSDATDYAIDGPYYRLIMCKTEEATNEAPLGEEEVQDLI